MGARGVEIDNQGGLGFVIAGVHAFLAVHPDGTESMLGAEMPDGSTMALLTVIPEMVDELRPYAEVIARETQIPVRLVKFTGREDLETIR